MKRLTIFLLLIFSSFSMLITGCGGDGNTIRLNEVTRSIFYAPLYVAINEGFFEEEGLNIDLITATGSNVSMTALVSGSADIALCGPETNVYVQSQGKQDYPVIFGQLTKRDGSFLISRTNETNFSWSNLENKHVIAGRKGGSPAMSLQYALKLNNIIPGENVNFDLSVPFDMTVPTFSNGTGDYVTMFEPAASSFVATGKGYIVAAVGQESGEVPFTSFSANKSYIENNPEKIEKFLRAVMKGYEFIMQQDIEDVIDSLVPSFNTTSRELIQKSIENYKSIDAWCSTPVMSETAFNRLLDVMQNAGELDERVEYSTIVNTEIASRVMGSL